MKACAALESIASRVRGVRLPCTVRIYGSCACVIASGSAGSAGICALALGRRVLRFGCCASSSRSAAIRSSTAAWPRTCSCMDATLSPTAAARSTRHADSPARLPALSRRLLPSLRHGELLLRPPASRSLLELVGLRAAGAVCAWHCAPGHPSESRRRPRSGWRLCARLRRSTLPSR